MKVAIDGPAGAGKSTISKAAAKELGFIYIDTGAMYRAVALYLIRKNINTKDAGTIIPLLEEIKIDIKHVMGEQHVFLCGEDVSDRIRTPEVSMGASNVAVIPEVRTKLIDLQRELALKTDVIMDGRDIGTHVLPDAEVKIFLTADIRERAKRRHEELLLKDPKCSFDDVLKDMLYRDKNDSEREVAPLKPAADSIIVDTTTYNLPESVNIIINTIKGRLSDAF